MKDSKKSEILIKSTFEKVANAMRIQVKSERTISDYRYHINNLCEKNKIISGNQKLEKAYRLLRIVKVNISDRFRVIQWLSLNKDTQDYEPIESQVYYMLKHTLR